jgi:hypothetical protein
LFTIAMSKAEVRPLIKAQTSKLLAVREQLLQKASCYGTGEC